MEVPEHLDALRADGPLLAAAAERAGWDARVPATDWNVRELVTHVGGVHRWAADIVASGGDSFDTEAGGAVGTAVPDDELLDWFRDGHAALVRTLRAAPADLDCATFLPAPSPLAFWARRQAHETAIHRADAERASGDPTPYRADFAQDGMAELLLGFAARKGNAVESPATISLAAIDGPSWLITFGDGRICAREDGGPADATIIGTSSEVYSWLWNRPSEVQIEGYGEVAALWRAVRIRWG
ncbi:MAG: maleylpyruvate isomerase family mycothiol-dependent enzyme [Jatrophihabitantaceae bacterium]